MSEAAKKIDDVDESTAEETPAQEAVHVPEQVKPIGTNRFGLRSEKENDYIIHVPHGTDPELCLEPDFYSHIAKHLGRGDVVTIEPDDLAWEMSVKVLDRGHNWANVRPREMFKYGQFEVQSDTPRDYKIEWAGQTDMFRVVYKGEVLKVGFAVEEFARRFASNHAQALKR
jgi:hypothetical protein